MATSFEIHVGARRDDPVERRNDLKAVGTNEFVGIGIGSLRSANQLPLCIEFYKPSSSGIFQSFLLKSRQSIPVGKGRKAMWVTETGGFGERGDQFRGRR